MMKLIIICSIALFATSCATGQRPMVPPSEVQIVNSTSAKVSFRGSLDKKVWSAESIDGSAQSSFSVCRNCAYYFVELCQQKDSASAVICDTFRLKPTKRYAIVFKQPENKLVIQIPRPPTD